MLYSSHVIRRRGRGNLDVCGNGRNLLMLVNSLEKGDRWPSPDIQSPDIQACIVLDPLENIGFQLRLILVHGLTTAAAICSITVMFLTSSGVKP